MPSVALNPSLPPSGNFNLSTWNLTLPTGTAGNPDVISTTTLDSGYTSQYFYTGPNGAMTFWCPVTGVTTSGSSNPRTELRETKPGTKHNWNVLDGTATLNATLAVNQVPGTGRIIIGQLHDNGAGGISNEPLIVLVYEYNSTTGTARSIVAEVHPTPSSPSGTEHILATGIKLNTLFSYQIQLGSDLTLSVQINGVTEYRMPIDTSWESQGLYFKAGDYVQDNVGLSTDGGQVSFSALTVTHTSVSSGLVTGYASPTIAGASHSFTVTAYDTRVSTKDAYGNTTPAYAIPGVQSIFVTGTSHASVTGSESGISVASVQPTASVSGPSVGEPGQPLSFTVGGSESRLSASIIYSYSVDWGDGSSVQTLIGPSGTQISHTFVAPGAYMVAVTATDPSGNPSSPVFTLTTVSVVVMETDPYNSSLTALAVGGTTRSDNIAITPANGGGVKVGMNMVGYGTFYPTGDVLVYGRLGNDIIKTAAQSINGMLTYVNVPVLFFAGNGNDILNVLGSIANSVLVGGAGSDRLIGGQGRDILIGGPGASTLQAGGGRDILIGGSTSYDNNAAALAAFLAEWILTDIDYATDERGRKCVDAGIPAGKRLIRQQKSAAGHCCWNKRL